MRKGLDDVRICVFVALLVVLCVLVIGMCVFCDFPCCLFIFSLTLGSSVPPVTLPQSVLFHSLPAPRSSHAHSHLHLVSVSSAVHLLFSLSSFVPLSSAQCSVEHHWFLCHSPVSCLVVSLCLLSATTAFCLAF